MFPSGSRVPGVRIGYWAPDVARYREQYYFYYSLVDREPEYALDAQGIGVATAQHPAGPFRDRGKLFQGLSDRFLGPGHNAIATDDCGIDWLLYHAYDRTAPFLANGPGDPRRSLMLDRLRWDEGWPRVENLAPSLTAYRPTTDPS